MKKHLLGTISILALLLSISACKDKEDILEGNGSIEVEFDNHAGDAPLNFGASYVTANGDTVVFSKFNYFVSNFKLTKDDGTEYVVPSDSCYFLCKHDDPASRFITINNIPAGDYTGLEFMIGVDSAKSVSPIEQRTGALDPAAGANGMYWSWNAGYIFMKLEGNSPSAPINANGEHHFEYHTGLFGGFSSPTLNNLKTVHLHSHEPAMVRRDGAPHFHLYVDALEVFTNPVNINIADNYSSHADPFSATVAENYKDMFILDHVHNP